MGNEPLRSVATIRADYAGKPDGYFYGARWDIVEMMVSGPESHVLEVGCGSGGTAEAVKSAGKADCYVGIELSPEAAAAAGAFLDESMVGDVETMDLSAMTGRFDAVIMSEVVEHLRDPWVALARLRSCLKPGGRIYASSPNVSHWAVVAGLVRGRFEYAEEGVMDRTHLRWFTPNSYAGLFRSSGFEVETVGPSTPLRSKARMFDWLTGSAFRHMLFTQITLVGRNPSS